MTKKQDGAFVVKKVVQTIPTRKNEEIRFQVVEINGNVRGDIRYFSRKNDGDEMLQTPRGLAVPIQAFPETVKGVGALATELGV